MNYLCFNFTKLFVRPVARKKEKKKKKNVEEGIWLGGQRKDKSLVKPELGVEGSCEVGEEQERIDK